MPRIFKTLLLWLLMAALPLQGFAAAMRMSCGPEHHEALPAVAMAKAHHHAGGSVHHHHDGMMHAHDEEAANSAGSSDNRPDTNQHKSSFCSACAACCAGAAAPPSLMVWSPVFTSSEATFITPATLVTGFIPGGLERPPRQLST
jgi:hypothetical protein